MINFILFFGSCILYSQTATVRQTQSCTICIIDSMCTDDSTYFNVSVSKHCRNPMNVFFTYLTDVNPKPRHYNTTTTCTNCYANIAIDTVRDAWDYTLTLQSPKPSKSCPTQRIAHCGGKMSRLIWFITGGLSGLSLAIGILVCIVKHCRSPKTPVNLKKKNVEASVINT